MSARAPNLVFVMADQLAASFLGCYGSGVDSTPCLDALAARGRRYERFYATCPLCAPNRATILTGRSPVVHGIIDNNFALATDTPTYAQALRAAGYVTGGFGKFHQTPMHCPHPQDLNFLGFNEAVVSEDPKWGPWLDWIEREHPEHFENALAMAWAWPNLPPPAKAAERLAAVEKLMKPLRAKSAWECFYPSPLPAELHDTVFLTNLALDFIGRHAGDERPFFVHLSYVDPHDPYDPPEPYASRYRAEDMPAPIPAAWREDGIASLHAAQRAYRRFDERCRDTAMIRQMRAFYHGSIRLIDDQVARVVAELERRGLWENTILVFATDHGDMMGDHGFMTKGVMHYDTCVRCPLIVAGGGIKPEVVGQLRCSLDLYPTFCDWAGVAAAARPPLEGRSLDADGWPEVAVALRDAQSVFTDDGWRLTLFPDEGKGQMFNLRADPREQRNLYADPARAAKRQELLVRLAKVLARPSQVPHYRNLPYLYGTKRLIHRDRMIAELPLHDDGPSPALDGTLVGE